MPNAGDSIGPYRIIRTLGKGGMGIVYLAQHRELGYRRAVKVLHRSDDPGALERFKREAQVAGELTHPHILKVEHYDIDATGRPYLVMPYLGDDEGPHDLDRHLKQRGGKLSGPETASIIRQILEGLACAHDQGVIHRDLKPANILLELQGNAPVVKIADFGLVRIAGEAAFRDRIHQSISQSLSMGEGPTLADRAPDEFSRTIADRGSSTGTSTRALIGTWSYMSPQQKTASGGVIDHRADLYAVGLLAYRLLMGELPSGMTKSPGQVDPSLAAWDQWLSGMLESNPKQRTATAKQALAALPQTSRKLRSPLRPAAIAATVIILAGATVTLALWQPWNRPTLPGNMAANGSPSSVQGLTGQLSSSEQQLSAGDRDEDEKRSPTPAESVEPAVSLADVVPVKSAISTLRAEANLLDPGQGFGERLRVMETNWTTAEEFYRKEVYGDAMAYYQKVRTVCTELLENDRARQSAQAASDGWNRALGALPEPLYAGVRRGVDDLKKAARNNLEDFEAGRFVKASEAWKQYGTSLARLLQQHAEAKSTVGAARQVWTDRKPAPSKWYADSQVSEKKTEAERLASSAQRAFDTGDFNVASDSYGEAVIAWDSAIRRHEQELTELLQAGVAATISNDYIRALSIIETLKPHRSESVHAKDKSMVLYERAKYTLLHESTELARKRIYELLKFDEEHLGALELLDRNRDRWGYSNTLNLVRGTINGQEVNATTRWIHVSRHDALTGSITVAANNSTWGGGSVVPIGYTVTWGDRKLQPVRIGHVSQGKRNIEIPLKVTAPAQVGQYFVIIAYAARYNIEQVMSGTSTTVSARWNDGNDLGWDWNHQNILEGRYEGIVTHRLWHKTGYKENSWTPATWVGVRVD